jgi:hypothetical protein
MGDIVLVGRGWWWGDMHAMDSGDMMRGVMQQHVPWQMGHPAAGSASVHALLMPCTEDRLVSARCSHLNISKLLHHPLLPAVSAAGKLAYGTAALNVLLTALSGFTPAPLLLP